MSYKLKRHSQSHVMGFKSIVSNVKKGSKSMSATAQIKKSNNYPTDNHQNHHDKSTILRSNSLPSPKSPASDLAVRKAWLVPLWNGWQGGDSLGKIRSSQMSSLLEWLQIHRSLRSPWNRNCGNIVEVELQLIQSRGRRSLGNPVNPEFNTPCWTTPLQNNPTNIPENQRCHQNLGIPRPTCPREALLPPKPAYYGCFDPKATGEKCPKLLLDQGEVTYWNISKSS